MLVLTRTREEEIRIGDEIVVRVLDVKGDRVRLGIAAPPHVSVHRQEVYLEIERTNREALNVEGSSLEKAKEILEDSLESVKSVLPGLPSRPKSSPREKAVDKEVAHGA